MTGQPKPEFSIDIALDDLPPQGRAITFEASAAECAALAKRFDLIELRSLKGEANMRHWRKLGVALEGRFEADVVQACVVTLEPVPSRLAERFKVHFLPADMLEEAAGGPGAEREIIIDTESDEPPEPFEAGHIDVGEMIAEQLALALDPYPRKEGVSLDEPLADQAEADEVKPNPFAALEKLKKKD
ncbi:DUF177 domain-containing protein [Parvibaculum sp.]|uniref:DUF177 domain-containing protein n=1 Tax=Parvibaculum sp. TaxID=2024848 RepID=UPI002BBAC861|nr:DUF177 domain-containing protein [Parvibaculum sp.]HUD50242.1 DUF177 domain-containing protein [Parvibaculum sp.]